MSSTVPEECGKCIKCGNTLYMYLAHYCSTAVNPIAPSIQTPPSASATPNGCPQCGGTGTELLITSTVGHTADTRVCPKCGGKGSNG